MLINHNREKLINAMVYFAKNTKYCGETKLFKLLYLLDFEHFSKTGRSVTGLDYYAWENGPVPKALFFELKSPPKDLAEKISISSRETKHTNPIMLITTNADFDPKHFTERELRLLRNLSKRFKNAMANKIVEVTHLENEAWHRMFSKRDGQNKKIPYEYVLRENEKELIRYMISENEEMLKNYK